MVNSRVRTEDLESLLMTNADTLKSEATCLPSLKASRRFGVFEARSLYCVACGRGELPETHPENSGTQGSKPHHAGVTSSRGRRP